MAGVFDIDSAVENAQMVPQRTAPGNAAEAAATTTQRSRDLKARGLEDTQLDTSKTPEMMRTEAGARRTDMLNNQQYWRGSGGGVALAGARTGGAGPQVTGQGYGAYQFKPITTEDQRAQELNRQRYMEKLQYDEVERHKMLNEAMLKLDMGGQLNMSDLEKLRVASDQEIYNLLRTNKEQLRAFVEGIPARSMERVKQMAERFNFNVDMAEKTLEMLPHNPYQAMVFASMFQIPLPGIMEALGMQIASNFFTDDYSEIFRSYFGGK